MTADPMLIILACGAIAVLLTIWAAHRSSSSFDAFDLITENGRVSKIAFAFMLVLGVSTWVIVDQQIKGKLDSGMFLSWLGAWLSPIVTRLALSKTEPPGTTTVAKIESTEKTTS